MQEQEDHRTLVFSGSYTEAVFLKSLLEAAAIEASFEVFVGAEQSDVPRRRDAQAALELIEDFRRNGKKTL